ncbi:enoyl-CoA hydratase [Sphingobium sp. AEW4]|nr:enoyl-CoA hydratase [Sphingobium sp. AEW4]
MGAAAIGQVLVEDHGDGVRAIVLNRPERRNAFTSGMTNRLHDLLVEAVNDDDVRVIVLRANGDHFCAGGDLDEMLARGAKDGLGRKNNVWKEIERIPLLLERSDKPMIAAMQGACRGAGVDLGLMCDIRIAGKSVEFAETYVNLGMLSGAGGGWFLPRIIGAARALEMFWTGASVHAEEAEKIGLVSHVVDDAELADRAIKLARKIARQPVESVRFFRRSVYQALTMPLYGYLDMVSSHMSVLRDTDDHRACIEALMKKIGR